MAAVIEMNIMEDLATIDRHMSALDSTAVDLSDMAIAPHLTVFQSHICQKCLFSNSALTQW